MDGVKSEETDPAALLQRQLGYFFAERELLSQALTHRSCPIQADAEPASHFCTTGEGVHHNERLEFLGDAVLELAISTLLFKRYPNVSEGVLSHWRSSLVNTRSLSVIGRTLSLGAHLQMGRGEQLSGGRGKSSILGNSMEAILGAIFLDGGYTAVHEVVEKLFRNHLDGFRVDQWEKDFKTLLQEWLQGVGRSLPEYRVASVSGPPHERLFQVECQVDGSEPGWGEGRSKRLAEQAAAKVALAALGESPEGGSRDS